MISILTPTYNREKLLKRLYNSLSQQTEFSFEWLIIDDGSQDNTRSTISELSTQSPFPIRYIYKKNGGKHTALNIGFDHAEGDWIFMVDSDDWLAKDCISTLQNIIKKLPTNIGSISILRAYSDGAIIGDQFPATISNYIERIEHGVAGDKGDMFRKSAIESFRFPVFKGENFMAESPLFMWAGKSFKTAFINYPGYICEYQQGGLSATSNSNRHKCYQSTLYVYSTQYLTLSSKKLRVKAAINWWRFRFGKKLPSKGAAIPWFYAAIGLLAFLSDYIRIGDAVFSHAKKKKADK